MENIIQSIFSKNSHWRCLLVKSCSAPKSFNLGMKILKATSCTMGVPLSISTYLGPQLVEHIRLSLIIESKSKQFQSRYLQIITSLPYTTHMHTHHQLQRRGNQSAPNQTRPPYEIISSQVLRNAPYLRFKTTWNELRDDPVIRLWIFQIW